MEDNDQPLSAEEIAGFMNWRGPGAYTAAAERRVRRLIAEAVKRERAACAKVCKDHALRYGEAAEQAIKDGEHDDVSSIRATAWQLTVASSDIINRGA